MKRRRHCPARIPGRRNEYRQRARVAGIELGQRAFHGRG